MQELYNNHLEINRKNAYIKSMEAYNALYKRSVDNPEAFWNEQAQKFLSWSQKWDAVLDYNFDDAEFRWFLGGRLNASYNCLDRHLEKRKDKIAYFWEGDDSEETRTLTYSELYNEVNRFAAVLKVNGVKKGDRVVIYMPMIIEQVIAMLACARIGAIHCVVFIGFSAKVLANCIRNCKAKILITADGGFYGGIVSDHKTDVDAALEKNAEVKTVIVVQHTGNKMNLTRSRDIWWHKAMADTNLPDYTPPEPMEANDPLFILYFSDFTEKPKGIVHTHGGYLLYTAMTTRLVFDLKENDIFWCTMDIGRIVGHSYGVYGPLLNGQTSVLFEGVPDFPDFGRYWAIVAKYAVNQIYTSPAVLRMLSGQGDHYVQNHDLSSLRLVGFGGEGIDPDTWRWCYHVIGREMCSIADTYFQTETGGHMLAPLPGVAPLKPGSCSFPFFGVDPVILDDTGEETKYPNQEGVLCIRKPWPGMAHSVYGDHERFIDPCFSRIHEMYFTGDAASKDEDGYFRIIGRVDDVINVSGFNLHAADFESTLNIHALVSEAAVVGYPHPVKGRGVYAFVALKAGAVKSDELKQELADLVRNEIGPVSELDVIQWTEGLPKTRSGKILRNILDKIAAGKLNELGDTSAIADPALIESLITERTDVRYD